MNTELERIQKESQQMEIQIAELRGARAVLKLDRESPHWDIVEILYPILRQLLHL